MKFKGGVLCGCVLGQSVKIWNIQNRVALMLGCYKVAIPENITEDTYFKDENNRDWREALQSIQEFFIIAL